MSTTIITCPVCGDDYPDDSEHKCIERTITMNKELIERMKKNEKPFGLLNCKEQRLLCSIGREFCQYYAAKGFPWLELNRGDNQFDETLTYRICPDYAPEPEVIRCEVYEKDGQLYYDHPVQKSCFLNEALNDKDFIACEYVGGSKYGYIRQSYQPDEGGVAEYPVAVLFAKGTK